MIIIKTGKIPKLGDNDPEYRNKDGKSVAKLFIE